MNKIKTHYYSNTIKLGPITTVTWRNGLWLHAQILTKQEFFEDFDVKKWPVIRGQLYITNSSVPRNVACQASWSIIEGGLFGRLNCNCNSRNE